MLLICKNYYSYGSDFLVFKTRITLCTVLSEIEGIIKAEKKSVR